MTGQGTIDVSELPTHAFGVRSLMFWGALLSIAIEASMMALMLVTFIYTRGNYDVWPPSSVGPVAFQLAGVQMVILLLSLPPTILANHCAVGERWKPMKRWLWVATALGLASCVVRGFEFPKLVVRWDENAYGSLIWVTLGLHTTHILSGVAENLMMLTMLSSAVPEKKHFSDVQVGGVLWYFVVGEWLVAYPLLYWGPVLMGR